MCATYSKKVLRKLILTPRKLREPARKKIYIIKLRTDLEFLKDNIDNIILIIFMIIIIIINIWPVSYKNATIFTIFRSHQYLFSSLKNGEGLLIKSSKI